MRRGIALLAAAALAAGAFAATPAFSAKTVKKKTVKKIVRNLGSQLFIEEGVEIDRFGPVKLSVGQTAPLATYGPFTFTADCQQGDFFGDGPPFENRGRILVTTSENNSHIDSDADSDDDFDTVDGAVAWAEEEQVVGSPEMIEDDDASAHVVSPSGTAISALGNIILVNIGGTDCTISGGVLTDA